MLDVAACAKAILDARPGARRTVTNLLNIEENRAIELAILIAALHDLGKFAAPFQQKAEGPIWPYSKARSAQLGNSQHDRDGLVLWKQNLSGELSKQIWPSGGNNLEKLIGASAGHHGRAVNASGCDAAETFQQEGVNSASDFAQSLVDLILAEPITAPAIRDQLIGAATFWFAGFVTIADWVGSTQAYFPYSSPDIAIDEYWRKAQAQAKTAVSGLGLVPAAAGELKPFATLTGRRIATPLQSYVENMEFPQGPTLVIIEDVTGAGKTEAAQMIVHRLITDKRASGAYWAMPTQATANAMYERQQAAISELFAKGARPQLVLAHGGSRLHEGFQQTIFHQDWGNEETRNDLEADETATAACAAFLADDARAGLLADVGAGTIDQAILGVLPARFQAVRLFGLSDKVLVIDEAHAYDAYVGEELECLLKFHAALGGSAIVLSATLPRDVSKKSGREQIVHAWREGCGANMEEWRGKKLVQNDGYPLVTTVSNSGPISEQRIEAAAWSQRKAPVKFVEKTEDVIDAMCAAAKAGGAVGWVRNTVDEAIHAGSAFRSRGLNPIVFHSRFAQSDRQKIEAEVMECLGPNAPNAARRGTVVVATQVIEQSLDLDFDLLASDLAPIDLLIQRAGRLRRHSHRDAERPDVPFALIIRAPHFDAQPRDDWLSSEMKPTQAVYRDPALLWRSMKALRKRGAINTPNDLRDLIEDVYSENAEVPTGLSDAANSAEGRALAEGSHAQQNLLRLRIGYSSAQSAWVSEEREQVRTRLSDPQTTLRLAQLGRDGILTPWAGPRQPLWRSWALSEVKVSRYRVPLGSAPVQEFANVCSDARRDWGKRERTRTDLIILPLEEINGAWQGALTSPEGLKLAFSYSYYLGLQFA